MSDASSTTVYVVAHNRVPGVHAPGIATRACIAKKCTSHTFDWRLAPGSAGNAHRVRAELARTPLGVALSTHYTSEAHLTGYAVLQGGAPLVHQPRVAKDALPWMRAEGFELVLTTFMADVDTPGHVPWTPELLAAFDALWASRRGPLATCGLYLSPKGYRLVQPLARWVPVEDGEARLRTWLRELVAVGIDPHVEDVHDWTRLMRTPHHRRPTGPVVSPRIELERMVPIEPPTAAADVKRVVRRRTPLRAHGDGASVVPMFGAEVPPGWEHAADVIGAAIRDHVRDGWRRCYLALSAALCARGCPPEGIPAVIGRAHCVDKSYPEWEGLLPDRLEIARTTVVRWTNGQELIGYAALRETWPALADALDATTVDGVEARVLRQLAVPPARPMPVAEAVATIRRTIERAYGVTCIAAPPGTGKTHAVAEHARHLPVIQGRAAPGARIAVSAPRHDLARQTAEKLPSALHLFSPPSLLAADGTPVCAYAESARYLSAGRQSARRELCEGRGRNPCDLADGCRAREGLEGDEHANLVVGVHGLVRELRAYAGTSGVLVVDEPGDVTVIDRVTLDDIETARRYLDAFTLRYALRIGPALEAFSLWLHAAPLDGPLTSLQDAVSEGAPYVSRDVLEASGIDADGDVVTAVLVSAAEAIAEDARTTAPPLEWRSVVTARANAGRAAEISRASELLDLLWRGITSKVQFCARVDDRNGERAASVVSINADLLSALEHQGPVVILDANAGLHVPAITRVIGSAPAVVDLTVADGAPITRTVLATGNANRRVWMPRGVPAWDAIVPALRAALAWAAEDPTTQRLGLIAPKELHVAFAHVLRPNDPATLALVRSSRLPRRTLDQVRQQLAPVFSGWRGEILTGHFGALEGLDFMSGCDATITLMDPRPNLGDEQLRAEFLALDLDGRLDALAAAELQQAHGRLRTIHRTRPGRQLHVGAVVPAGWPGLPVEVRHMPTGRPRASAGAMSGADLVALRTGAGLGVREMARALGLSDGTVRRYESGERVVPDAVAEAARALLASSAPETPCKSISLQGVSGASDVQRPATGGFGRTQAPTPLQGVSGAASVNTTDDPPPGSGGGGVRRTRRVDLKALLGATASPPTAPMARASGDWRDP